MITNEEGDPRFVLNGHQFLRGVLFSEGSFDPAVAIHRLEFGMLLTNTIWIDSTPEQVFAFFEHMDANYVGWHPDHRLFRWEQGRGVREGVTCYYEEIIADKLMKNHMVYTRVEPNRHIEFTFTNRLRRLILPRILFHVEPEAGGIQFTAEIHIRIGPVGAWLNRGEFAAVRQHMREEGENLKRLLEAAA